VALGWRWADPVAGLGITTAIAAALKDAAREVYRRLMDAVHPRLIDQAEATLRTMPGVRDVTAVRMRWIAHRLHAEADLVVDDDLPLLQAYEVATDAERQLVHAMPRLAGATLAHRPRPAPSGGQNWCTCWSCRPARGTVRSRRHRAAPAGRQARGMNVPQAGRLHGLSLDQANRRSPSCRPYAGPGPAGSHRAPPPDRRARVARCRGTDPRHRPHRRKSPARPGSADE
jgi:Dimerisation domain of Zinc Transporter